MIKVLLLLINCIVLTYFLFRINVYIDICYVRKSGDDNIVLQIYTWKKWLCYKFYIPAAELVRHEEFLKVKMEVKTPKHTTPSAGKSEQRFFIKTIYNLLKIPPKINQVIALFKHYKKIYISFMEELYLSIQCEKFIWKTRCGSEDAALTAIMAGGLWGLKSLVFQKMKSRIQVIAVPQIYVIPVYNQSIFEFDIQCIFSIRLGNVINATFNLIKHMIRGQ